MAPWGLATEPSLAYLLSDFDEILSLLPSTETITTTVGVVILLTVLHGALIYLEKHDACTRCRQRTLRQHNSTMSDEHEAQNQLYEDFSRIRDEVVDPKNGERVYTYLHRLGLPAELIILILDYASYRSMIVTWRRLKQPWIQPEEYADKRCMLYQLSTPIRPPSGTRGRPTNVHKVTIYTYSDITCPPPGVRVDTWDGGAPDTDVVATILRDVGDPATREERDRELRASQETHFASVESAAAVLARYGKVFVPRVERDEWHQERIPWHVSTHKTWKKNMSSHDVEWRRETTEYYLKKFDLMRKLNWGLGVGFVDKLREGDVIALWSLYLVSIIKLHPDGVLSSPARNQTLPSTMG